MKLTVLVALIVLFFASTCADGATRADFEAMAERAAARYDVPASLLKAVCHVENQRWHPRAIGDDGRAIGLCQVWVSTALIVYGRDWLRGRPAWRRRAAMRDLLMQPELNLDTAARLLRSYLDLFDGDETMALMAYNGGPAHRLLGYVRKVKAARERYRE